MMQIQKILNNNAVVCLDLHGNEVIVRGKGIAYKKTVGEDIDDTKVEKVYRLDTEIKNKFQELIKTLSDEYMSISDEIIQYANIHLGKRLNDIIYISLVDHIALAIERSKQGISVSNPLLFDIKRFYPEEFKVGQNALQIIKEKMRISLREDEAGFIALHIVNAQFNEEKPLAYHIARILHEILTIVRLRMNIVYQEDSVFYYRFVTHLKFFAQRLFTESKHIKRHEDDLLTIIKSRYAKSYECVKYIEKYIRQKYVYELTEDEQLYLTIHIQKIAEESKRGDEMAKE